MQTWGALCMNDTNYRTKHKKNLWKYASIITSYVKIRPSLDGVWKGLVLCQVFIAVYVRFTSSICPGGHCYRDRRSWEIQLFCVVIRRGKEGRSSNGTTVYEDISHQIALPLLPAVYLGQEVDGNRPPRTENKKKMNGVLTQIVMGNPTVLCCHGKRNRGKILQ